MPRCIVIGDMWIEVTGPCWPHGLAAFVWGAILGRVVGGGVGHTQAARRAFH